MHRTESDNKIVVGGKNQFTNGPPGTTRDAVDINTGQEELAYVIEQAGLTLKTVATETNTQLKEAIDVMIAASVVANPQYSVEFAAKDLLIDVISVTTADVECKRLSLLNSSFVPAFINDLSTTFNITTDLMAGTAEKSSHWYQLWIDSLGVRKMVPDLIGASDGTNAGFLVDSTNTFATDGVVAGDIIYNLTDNTKTTVSSTPTVDGADLAVTDDIFVNLDDYTIHLLSPAGLGSYIANIGAVYNDAASNLRSLKQTGKTAHYAPVTLLSGGAAAVLTAVDLSSAIPVTAKSVDLMLQATVAGSAVGAFISSSASLDEGYFTRTGGTGWTTATIDSVLSLTLSYSQVVYYTAHLGTVTLKNNSFSYLN
jgi:hypothetical protein